MKIINPPIFNNSLSNGVKCIYHYTNAESFFSIIRSMSLKMSSFSNSNDLNEANLANVDIIKDVHAMQSIDSFIKRRCMYLSFTRDKRDLDGSEHPRMWAQYADNGKGVCIAINEDRFKKINHLKLKETFFKFKNVHYVTKNGANVELKLNKKTRNEYDFITHHNQELFFKKNIDWRDEHERRCIVISKTKDLSDLSDESFKYLSILGAIEYICLGANFTDMVSNLATLVDIISNPLFKCHNYLVPQSFAIIKPYSYGYLPLDFAYEIHKACKQI